MATIVSTRISRLQSVSPRSTSGIDQSGVVVSLSNSAVSLPADSLGTVTSYAGATTTISVTHGGVDQSSLWAFTKADGSGVTSSLSGQTLTVSSLVVDFGQVTITASRAGYTSQTRTFSLSRAKSGSNGTNGASGANGQRGSVTLYASGSAWSDSTANSAIVTATGSSTRVIGDTVTISNGSSFAKTRYWSGTAWVDPGVVIDGNLLVNGTLSAAKVGAGTLAADNVMFSSTGGTLKFGTGATNGTALEVAAATNFDYGLVVSTGGIMVAGKSAFIDSIICAGSSKPAIKATNNTPGINALEVTGPAYITGNLTINGALSASSVSGLSKSSVGLGNVDNTADADKSVNTAAQCSGNSASATQASYGTAWGWPGNSVSFTSVGGWWTSQAPTGFIRCSLGLIPYYPG